MIFPNTRNTSPIPKINHITFQHSRYLTYHSLKLKTWMKNLWDKIIDRYVDSAL